MVKMSIRTRDPKKSTRVPPSEEGEETRRGFKRGGGRGACTHFPCHPSLPRSRRMGDGLFASDSVGFFVPRPRAPATGRTAIS